MLLFWLRFLFSLAMVFLKKFLQTKTFDKLSTRACWLVDSLGNTKQSCNYVLLFSVSSKLLENQYFVDTRFDHCYLSFWATDVVNHELKLLGGVLFWKNWQRYHHSVEWNIRSSETIRTQKQWKNFTVTNKQSQHSLYFLYKRFCVVPYYQNISLKSGEMLKKYYFLYILQSKI